VYYTSNPSILRVSIRKTKYPSRLTSNVPFRTLKRIFQFTYQIKHIHIIMCLSLIRSPTCYHRETYVLSLVLLCEPKYPSCFCTSLGYYIHKNQPSFLKVTWALGVVRSTLAIESKRQQNEYFK